ncbi:ribosome-recycling factor, mitochondrial [Bacillus rossius redtenbacheri]|uniref:ribosome-recycling factor, mitochondrial n=1 Tax=Bacillus rossius redtenbacheri TaxID=93214 RepID=UPI002FDDCB32
MNSVARFWFTLMKPVVFECCRMRTVVPVIHCLDRHVCCLSASIVKQNFSRFLDGKVSPVVPLHCVTRSYAKGKDRGKADKVKKKVVINFNQLAEVVEVDAVKKDLQRVVDVMKIEYVKNLSLRSTTGSLESLPVEFEGKEHTLQELAQIVRKNPKTIVVNMAIFPQAIPAVLQAIQKSGLNLNPQQDKTTLYIPVPKVTREHRENLAKNAKTLFIKCRDSIKDVQNKYVKAVKNNKTISEDLSYSCQEQIIALADQYIQAAEKILEEKQAELIGKD